MAEKLRLGSEVLMSGLAEYDAFISYSHAADDQLAPALQTGLRSLGKLWYRQRALRVFRDKTSLSATPELWPTIEHALAESRYFILLASPEAAASRWVDQEISWWRAYRSSSTVLIGLTGGDLAWDDVRQMFDPARTTALPPSALRWFTHEPLWVDLRWAHQTRHVSLRDPRFRECVADLAAPIRGLPKDELIGEDIDQHRRARRIIQGGVTLLAVLTTLAIVAAFVAVGQRNTAREQSSLASARQVASAAVANIPQRLDLSLLFAVQAYHQQQTPQTEAALLQAATASPHLVRFADNGTPVTTLVPFLDGTRVATGGEDGTLRIWDLASDGDPVVVADFDQPVTAVGVDTDGRQVAVGGSGGLVVVLDTTTRQPTVLQTEGPAVLGIALDAAGVRAAIVDDTSHVTVFDVAHRRIVGSADTGGFPEVVAFHAHGNELLLGEGVGSASRWSVSPLRRVSEWTGHQTPAGNYTAGYSSDRTWFGYYKFGILVTDAVTASNARDFPLESRTFASAIAIAQDASRVAVASGGTISVVQADFPYEQYGNATQEGGLIADPLLGVGTTITGLVFVGGRREQLVSASQRILTLWNLRQQSRIAQRVGPDLPELVEASTRPGLAVSPRDGTVAWVGDDGKITLRNPQTGQVSVAVHDSTVMGNLYFTPDGKLLKVGWDSIGVWEVNGQSVRQIAFWPYPADVQTSIVVPTADGSKFVIVGDDGNVATLSTSDGLIKTVVKGGERYSFYEKYEEVVLRPDDAELLVIQADGSTHFIDLQTGQARPGPAFGFPVSSASYSPDGRRLAVTDGQTSLLVWDTETSQVIRRTAAERITQIKFNPTGDRLVTITGDGRIAVWDIASGLRLGDLQVRQFETFDARDVGYQTQLAWDHSGSVLWTATTGGTVLRWDLDPEAWIRSACAAAGRFLTTDDWQNVGGPIPNDLSCSP